MHNYPINTISVCANGENFISADDYSIHLWNIENKTLTFNILELPFPKTKDDAEYFERFSAVQFHPKADNLFVASTNTGLNRLCDMRFQSTCNDTAQYFEADDNPDKRDIKAIIDAVSDVTFSPDGRYIYARDFIEVKIWDVNQLSKPVATIPLYPPVTYMLADILTDYSTGIDRFTVASNYNGKYLSTGFFDGALHIVDTKTLQNTQITLNYSRKLKARTIPTDLNETFPEDFDYMRQVLRTTWHPKTNLVAAAMNNSVFLYNTSAH